MTDKNQTIGSILERRSVREYKKELPPIGQLEEVLNAAAWAPSARNVQECHVSLVADEKAVKSLGKAITQSLDAETVERLKARFSEGSEVDVFYGAPAVYVVSAENPQEHYTKIDIGITMQTICIAAKSFGIDTCMIGLSSALFDTDANHPAIKALNIPQEYTPVIAVIAGYATKQPTPPERKEGRTQIV